MATKTARRVRTLHRLTGVGHDGLTRSERMRSAARHAAGAAAQPSADEMAALRALMLARRAGGQASRSA